MSHSSDSSILSMDSYRNCRLCPRQCGADRTVSFGYCGCGDRPKAARAALHLWEEPCISGTSGSGAVSTDGESSKSRTTSRDGPSHAGGESSESRITSSDGSIHAGSKSFGGSGAVFFSGCTLGCCFCQNYKISHDRFGKEISVRQLADIFLRLQAQGAYNINLVTATQYLPSVIAALDLVKEQLRIPVVYNCGGYERPEVVAALEGYVDIWLPDLKYMDSRLSLRYSQAEDYFLQASQAVRQMIRQTGRPVLDCRGLMKSGVIIRHMVLPGARQDSIRLLHWMRDNLPVGEYYLSLMSQYTPAGAAANAAITGAGASTATNAANVSIGTVANATIGTAANATIGTAASTVISASIGTVSVSARPSGRQNQLSGPLYPELTRRVTTFEYESVLNTALDLDLGLDLGYMQQKSSAKEEFTPPFDLEGI